MALRILLVVSAFLSPGQAFAQTVGDVRYDYFDEKARDYVWAFEMRLHKWPKDKVKERDQAIREFFAGLKDRNTKIAAIGMTDSRYVYVVPRDLGSELMGEFLKDPDLAVRLRAAHSLGYNGKAGDHFEAIVALRKDTPDASLQPVIYAMGRANDRRFLPHLVALLKHDDAKIRAQAVFVGRWFPDKEIIGSAMALWDDPDQQVRYNLLGLLDARTEEGARRLVERLKDPSPHVRTAAVDYLGRSKLPGVAKTIATMLGDPDPYVRGKALEALGNLQAREYLGTIVRRFGDPAEDVYVRRMAILSFEKMPNPEYLQHVRDALRDEDNQVREHAARIAASLVK